MKGNDKFNRRVNCFDDKLSNLTSHQADANNESDDY